MLSGRLKAAFSVKKGAMNDIGYLRREKKKETDRAFCRSDGRTSTGIESDMFQEVIQGEFGNSHSSIDTKLP